MCDFTDSSQNKAWLYTPQLLLECRARANREAREALGGPSVDNAKQPTLVPIRWWASGYGNSEREEQDYEGGGPWKTTSGGHDMLTPTEETMLISFYSSHLPGLIGPQAQVPRMRRDVKVVATAGLIFRRFFLSNSVMIHDPKTTMVAAAFLASKVEDCMADIRFLEEGTQLMNAPVGREEILPAELRLIEGVHFELMCFHPYRAVLAYTEDLRTFLKSEKGRTIVKSNRPIVGEDLRPMHDAARQLIDLVIISDIPLLFSPGKVGLAALMVANEESAVRIDFMGYVKKRFDDKNLEQFERLATELIELSKMLKGLRKGEYGCGANENLDMTILKRAHKKLKKCRAWGEKKKKKKRKAEEMAEGEK